MQPSSLAQSIRDAFLGARDEANHELFRLSFLEPQLEGLEAEDLVALVREQIASGPVWLALVRAYREASRAVLGPLLLEMLAPLLVAASTRLQPVPPVVSEEDIRQDLVFEALRALAAGTLPRDPRWIPRHVTLRAMQAVARHLAMEKRRQDHQVPLDEDAADQVEAAQKGRPRIPRTENVRRRAQNVRCEGSYRVTTHVHKRSRAAVSTRARISHDPRKEELMNTASNHLHPWGREGGDS